MVVPDNVSPVLPRVMLLFLLGYSCLFWHLVVEMIALELLDFSIYFQKVFPDSPISTSLGNAGSSSNKLSNCNNWRWAG